MKKVRVFFAAAALLLVTAGVFAGKVKFTTAHANDLYYSLGAGNYQQFGSTYNSTPLIYFNVGSSPSGTQSTILVGGNSYSVYTYDPAQPINKYVPVY